MGRQRLTKLKLSEIPDRILGELDAELDDPPHWADPSSMAFR